MHCAGAQAIQTMELKQWSSVAIKTAWPPVVVIVALCTSSQHSTWYSWRTVSKSTTMAVAYIFGLTRFYQICHSDLGIHASGLRWKFMKKNVAQKIESYVKFNRPKGFFILRIFSKFLRIFKTLKKYICGKKSKIYTEESVENFLD